jgi:hypothetical protein
MLRQQIKTCMQLTEFIWIAKYSTQSCLLLACNEPVSKHVFTPIKLSFSTVGNNSDRSLNSLTMQSPIAASHCFSPKIQFLVTDATVGNTDSATVTCDQPQDKIFSLGWINDWHSLKQNGLARSARLLADGSSAGNWTELIMAQNFTWYELISWHDWNTCTRLRQTGCVIITEQIQKRCCKMEKQISCFNSLGGIRQHGGRFYSESRANLQLALKCLQEVSVLTFLWIWILESMAYWAQSTLSFLMHPIFSLPLHPIHFIYPFSLRIIIPSPTLQSHSSQLLLFFCLLRPCKGQFAVHTWDMTPCSPLNVNRSFGWTFCLHLQGQISWAR